MGINRDNLIEKVRALMSKTVDNGCTEHEALAALDKARALMDAYEVSEDELQLTKAETAILRREPPGRVTRTASRPALRSRCPSSAIARSGRGQADLWSAGCPQTCGLQRGCSIPSPASCKPNWRGI